MPPDEYRLRLARLSEIEIIRAIERQAASRFRSTGFAWVADAEPVSAGAAWTMIELGQLFVAARDDIPVGFIEVSALDGVCYIDEVDVLPDHAGHRLAARLIDHAADWAASQNLPRLTLSTFRDIPWNAPYYRRLGFRDLDDLTPGLAAIRDRHRRLGLLDIERVFMWRPVTGQHMKTASH